MYNHKSLNFIRKCSCSLCNPIPLSLSVSRVALSCVDCPRPPSVASRARLPLSLVLALTLWHALHVGVRVGLHGGGPEKAPCVCVLWWWHGCCCLGRGAAVSRVLSLRERRCYPRAGQRRRQR